MQIYESVMAGPDGALTTGLLTAVRYVKDNRLLPRGFDKRTADKDVAVHGEALQDADFAGGGDRIRYSVAIGDAQGPFQVDAELWYQPIAHRWAANLKSYDAFEPRRFTGYYDSMSSGSGIVLARASATTLDRSQCGPSESAVARRAGLKALHYDCYAVESYASVFPRVFGPNTVMRIATIAQQTAMYSNTLA